LRAHAADCYRRRGVSRQTVLLDLEQLLMSGRFDVLDEVI
jgi:hypothetical protein